MKQSCLLVFLSLFSLPVIAQQGDELLVYSVKGMVTSVYRQEETVVKVGKVLLPGTLIKTQKNASLTMLCKKGNPLCLNKEGVFPISNWKDSCRSTSQSLLSNYFSYIWSQFYTYSPEYKEEMAKKNELAVSRGQGPFRDEWRPTTKISIKFSPGMDTVNYGGGKFPLSWTCFDFRGKYLFSLYAAGKLIFKDSVRNSYISIEQFKDLLEPGKSYRWTVSAPGSKPIRKRILNCVQPEKIKLYIDNLLLPLGIPEDSASQYFRVAYLLEKKHYLADALTWYQRATASNPEIELYRDRFIRFRNEFWIR